MSIVEAVKSSLGAKVSLTLAAVLLALTALAATYITARETSQMEELLLDKAHVAAQLGARHYGDALDGIIDTGLISVNDAFDRNYVEIKGHDWGSKPKYHTRYDSVVVPGVQVFMDKFLDQEDFIYALGVDENGYAPVHNARFERPLTGDPAKDTAGNRAKRIFNDPIGIAAAHNTEPIFQQVYTQDTGVKMWDVSSPIFVKGKKWGSFRIGVSMERIAARKVSLLLALIGVFLVFAVVTIGTMFLVVRRAMQPVLVLTRAAEQISLGEALDDQLKPASPDEIGMLTKAVDRLRVSMKAALTRLGAA